MSYGEDVGADTGRDNVEALAKGTLAYSLAPEDDKPLLVEAFQLLGTHVSQSIPDVARRRVFGRTLLGIREAIAIEEWVQGNAEQLLMNEDPEQLLALLWPVVAGNISNATFTKCNSPELLQEMGVGWIRGVAFYELLRILADGNARIGGGAKPRHPKIDHVIDICENALAYDGTLVLGAVCELAGSVLPDGGDALISRLQMLQKRLKYGVASESAIILYEMGFSDRVVANDLAAVVGTDLYKRREVRMSLRRNAQSVANTLNRFPMYFRERLK
jgi:hypothetical protein